MEPLYQAVLHLDEALEEGPSWMVFRKLVRMEDPFVAGQKAAPPHFPHHYAGENFISMTGESAFVMLRHKGLIGPSWRGHGTRIRDAVFKSSVFPGEWLFVRAEMKRSRQMWGRLFTTFDFEMWKVGEGGKKIVCYLSTQDAIFFDCDVAAPEDGSEG